MASNIEIAQELNKLLSEQLKIVEDQNKALKEQSKLANAVVETFSKVKNSRPGDSVNQLNKSMKDTEATAVHFSDAFSKGLHEISKRTYHADSAIKAFAGKLDKLLKTPARILAMEEAMKGLGEGIHLSNSILSSMVDTSSLLIKSFGNLGISILTLPFKMLNALMAEAANINGTELAQAIEDVRKQFGDLSKNEGKAVMTSFRSMGGELSNTGLSVRRVLGNFAERLKFLRETATEMGRSFNKFTGEFAKYGEEIAAYTKGLGLAGDQIKAVADYANATGKSMTEVGREMTTMAYGVGEAFGINGKLVSRDLSEMQKDFKNFGSLSIKQMTQVSVFTHKLGLEIKDLLGIIDKFDNFEDAAQSAAQLSQAFGLQLDTLDLMFDQDPASRFEKLRKSFAATGKTIESMTRQEKALLAQQTGLSESALQVGFSQSNMGMSYEEVQKQAGLTEKKQLSQAEAMDKLANSIERMVKQGQQMKGGFFDIFLQGFFQGIKWTKEWRQMMMNLHRAMRQIWRAGTEVGQAFVKMFPGVKQVFTGIAKLFDPKKWKDLRTGIVSVFKDFFQDLAGKSPFSLQKLYEKLKSLFFNYFNMSTPEGQQVVGGFKKFFGGVVDIIKQAVPWIMQGLTQVVTNITEFISNPTKYFNKAKNTTNPWVKSFIDMITPLWEAIVAQWPKLEKALKQLGTVAWDKFITFAKEHWSEALMGLGAYIAPSVLASITRAFGVTVVSAATKGIMGWALPKLNNVFDKFMGGFGDIAKKKISDGAGPATEAMSGALEGVGKVSKAAEGIPWKTFAKTMAMGAIGIAALGALSIAMAWFFKKASEQLSGVSATDAAKTMGVLGGMVLSMAGLAGLLLGVGFIITNPALLTLSGFGLVGLGALGIIAHAMIAAAEDLTKRINQMKIGADFDTKLNAFKTIIESLTGFAEVFVDLYKEAQPSFFSIKRWFGDKGENIKQTLDPLKNIIGAMTGGIKQIFDTVSTAIGGMQSSANPETVNSFINLFSTVVNMAGQLQSKNMGQILDKLSDSSVTPEALKKLTEKLSGHVWAVAGAIKQIVPLLSDTFAQIANLPLKKNEMQRLDAFGTFIQSFSNLATLLQGVQVKIDNPGETMINFMVGLQNAMVQITQLSADLKDSYIAKAGQSIRDMIIQINEIQEDLSALSKSGDLMPLNVQLKQTADKLGLAGTNEIKVKMDEINFNIYVDVKLSVDELEKSLLDKKDSKIARTK